MVDLSTLSYWWILEEEATLENLIYSKIKFKLFTESYSLVMSLIFQVSSWYNACDSIKN
jgi:hypothetical protein